jgi:transposase
VRELAEADVVKEVPSFAVTKALLTCPGLGPLRVAQLLATVITPDRFRTCRQFWSYGGLGIVTRSSSDWVRDTKGDGKRAQVAQTCGLSRQHNSALKNVFKGAATTVITKADSPLKAYDERLCKAGTKPNLAKVSLARKIAAIVLAMWKQGKEYSPPPITTP